MNHKHILISRVDAIGDVVLTLPICGFLKSHYPEVKISFLGRSYTKAVIESCVSIDQFLNYDDLKNLTSEKEKIDELEFHKIDYFIHVFPSKELAELARKAHIPVRIGTSHRLYHWWTCNKLINLGRKNAKLHESCLNFFLLKGLGINDFLPKEKIFSYYNVKPRKKLPTHLHNLLDEDKLNLVLHPKSHGSGMEWPLGRYAELINILPKNQIKIFISGSENEKKHLASWIKERTNQVTDITGKMNLEEFIAFLEQVDGFVASGTGPLHIAAALGIPTLGLFPSSKPINAVRWAPVGEKADYISSGTDDINDIRASDVYEHVKNWTNE